MYLQPSFKWYSSCDIINIILWFQLREIKKQLNNCNNSPTELTRQLLHAITGNVAKMFSSPRPSVQNASRNGCWSWKLRTRIENYRLLRVSMCVLDWSLLTSAGVCSGNECGCSSQTQKEDWKEEQEKHERGIAKRSRMVEWCRVTEKERQWKNSLFPSLVCWIDDKRDQYQRWCSSESHMCVVVVFLWACDELRIGWKKELTNLI